MPDIGLRLEARASRDAFVRMLGVDYSVPPAFVGRGLGISVNPTTVLWECPSQWPPRLPGISPLCVFAARRSAVEQTRLQHELVVVREDYTISRLSGRVHKAIPDCNKGSCKRIIVVVDVFTDGLTLREVARLLRDVGRREAVGITLARPKWNQSCRRGVTDVPRENPGDLPAKALTPGPDPGMGFRDD